MPGIDGFETTRRLKRHSATADVPILFMTGLSETEHIVEGFASGGVDYVTKPIVLDELTARIRVHLANARRERSARLALDTAGRFLLATDRAGRLSWATPQAGKHLTELGGGDGLPDGVSERLRAAIAEASNAPIVIDETETRRLQLTSLGHASDDEWLWRLMVDEAGGEEAALRRRFGLTAREAEVCLWVARGKSNRDIGDILGLSPRTVNKHLETVFMKLGVENRASAAVLALKTIEGG